MFGLLGSLPKRRRIADIVRDVALLPGPLRLWDSCWVSVPPVIVTAEDVCLWPYSVDILIKLVTSLGFSSLASDGGDLGRFQFEKAVPRCKRVDRPISVSAVLFGPGIDIRRSCRLLGAMLRALCVLPGGLGRFLPCAIGANHSRLVGFSLVMVSLPGLVRLLIFGSLMSCFFSLVTLLDRDVLCCVVLCL